MDREYMKGYIEARGIKLKAVAKALDYVPQTVYNMFYGLKEVNMEEALKMKKFLRMTNGEFKKAFEDEAWYSLYRSK